MNVGILTQMETSLHDEVCVDSGTDRSLTCAHLGKGQCLSTLGTNEIPCPDVSATSLTKTFVLLENEYKRARCVM